MKSIQDLAREAWLIEFIPESDIPKLQRFHDAAIAQYRESLLAGVGGPHTYAFEGNNRLPTMLYNADQIAAAVLWEREACAKVCDETVAHHYMKQSISANDEALLLAGCADCAAAIRGRHD